MMPPTRTREGIAGIYTRQDQDDATYSEKGRYCRSLYTTGSTWCRILGQGKVLQVSIHDRIKMMPPTRTREGIAGIYTRQDQDDATYSEKGRYCRSLYTTGSTWCHIIGQGKVLQVSIHDRIKMMPPTRTREGIAGL